MRTNTSVILAGKVTYLLLFFFFFKSVHHIQVQDHLFERATHSSYRQSRLLSIIKINFHFSPVGKVAEKQSVGVYF